MRARPAALRIGDAGPIGRILIAGEPGTAILVEASRPCPASSVIEKPGKGAFYATRLDADSARAAA